ncbi:MAG: hypothetical protein Q4G70_02275 [Pseudomonadota bacterium]|nr:hypothetical protein [Pseudomonadota bacterium]
MARAVVMIENLSRKLFAIHWISLGTLALGMVGLRNSRVPGCFTFFAYVAFAA